MKTKIISNLFVVALMILSAGSVANAQTSSLSVQPSSFHIFMNPSQKTLQSVLLVNQSNQPETLNIYTEDYKTAPDGAINFYYNSNESLSAKTWLIPQYTTVTVAPFDSKKIEYIVSASENMPGGGYNGAIIFQTLNTNTKTLGKPFGALVSIDVLKQGITTGGVIKGFSTPFFQYNDPTKIGFSVKNLGNANLSATGTISVYNLLGKQISQFKTGQLDVQPASSRVFNFQWTNSNLFGIYKTQVNLTNLLGKNASMSSSSWFVAIPWFAILFFVLAVAFALIAVRYRKTFFSKIFKGHGGSKKIKIRNTVNSNEGILSSEIFETSIKELFFSN